jgi:anti-sigma B factor antagonist
MSLKGSWNVVLLVIHEVAMQWTEEKDARLLTIRLSGEIDLQHSPKLRELLQSKVCLKAPVILLDFTDVKYIDSSGLATLVEYYKNSRGYSGRLAVAGLSNRVRSIFELVRLGEVFGIFPTVLEARQSLLAEPPKT